MKNNISLNIALITFLIFIQQLKGQVNTVVQFGHLFPVKEIAVHLDGKTCATTDGVVIKLWDLKTGIEIGELATGYEKMLPISHLSFIHDSTRKVLSFVVNNRIVFKDVRTNALIKIKDYNKSAKSLTNPYDELKEKYADRTINSKSMKRYEKGINKLNRNYEEEWDRYLSRTAKDGLFLSKKEQVLYHTEFRENKGIKRKFNKRYKAFKGYRKALRNKSVSDTNTFVHKIHKLHYKKQERSDKHLILVKESFRGKDKVLLRMQDNLRVGRMASNNLWLNENETYAIIGQALFNIRPKNKDKDGSIRRLIGIFPDQLATDMHSMSFDDKYYVRGRNTSDSTHVQVYDLTSESLYYPNKKKVYRDTSFYIPQIRSFSVSKAKSFKVLKDYLIVLYANGTLDAINILDGRSLLSELYSTQTELDPFTKVDAFELDHQRNLLYITGRTESYKNICFRAFSIESQNYLWSFGSEFPATKMKVVYYSSDSLITSVHQKVKNTLNSSLSQRDRENYEPIGNAFLDLKNLNNQGIEIDNSCSYDKLYSKWISQKGSMIYLNHRNSATPIQLGNLGKSLTFKWSSDSRYVAGYRDSSIFCIDAFNGKLIDSLRWNEAILDLDIHTPSDRIRFLDNQNKLITWVFQGSESRKPKPADAKKLGNVKKLNAKALKQSELYTDQGTTQLVSDLLVYSNIIDDKGLEKISEFGIGKKQLNKINSKANSMLFAYTQIQKIKDWANKKKYVMPEIKNDTLRKFRSNMPNRIQISPNGKYLYYLPYNGFEMKMVNLESPKLKTVIHKIPLKLFVHQSVLSVLEYAYLNSASGADIENARIIQNIRMEESIANYVAFDKNWNKVVYPHRLSKRVSKFRVKDLTTNKSIKIKAEVKGRVFPYISDSGHYLALVSRDELVNSIRIYDLQNKGKYVTKVIGHSGAVYFSQDEKYFVSCGSDNQLKVWAISKEKRIVDRPLFSYIVNGNSSDYLIYNEEGYYLTKKPSLNTIAFNYKGDTYPLEQFDLLKNRPDTILHDVLKVTLKSDTTTSLQLFKSFVNYRKSQSGQLATIAEINPSVMPEMEVSPFATYNGTDSLVTIQYSISNKQRGETIEVNIYNNNIPWYSFTLNDTLKQEGQLKLPLIYGANNFRFSVSQSNGYKSISKYLLFRRKIETSAYNQRQLHLVLIGVNEYNDPNLANLYKPVSDCDRFEQLFRNKSVLNSASQIIVHKLYNQSVSKEGIKALIDSFKQCSIHDEVVFVLAGHGKISAQKEFHFNLPHPSGVPFTKSASIAYSELIAMMQEIPVSRKLLILDACNSGVIVKNDEIDLKNTELYFKLFFNYSQPTGVQVISSAYGIEKADDGYFCNVFEKIVIGSQKKLSLNDLLYSLKEFNDKDPVAKQKISLTNINPQLEWELFNGQ